MKVSKLLLFLNVIIVNIYCSESFYENSDSFYENIESLIDIYESSSNTIKNDIKLKVNNLLGQFSNKIFEIEHQKKQKFLEKKVNVSEFKLELLNRQLQEEKNSLQQLELGAGSSAHKENRINKQKEIIQELEQKIKSLKNEINKKIKAVRKSDLSLD